MNPYCTEYSNITILIVQYDTKKQWSRLKDCLCCQNGGIFNTIRVRVIPQVIYLVKIYITRQ